MTRAKNILSSSWILRCYINTEELNKVSSTFKMNCDISHIHSKNKLKWISDLHVLVNADVILSQSSRYVIFSVPLVSSFLFGKFCQCQKMGNSHQKKCKLRDRMLKEFNIKASWWNQNLFTQWHQQFTPRIQCYIDKERTMNSFLIMSPLVSKMVKNFFVESEWVWMSSFFLWWTFTQIKNQ